MIDTLPQSNDICYFAMTNFRGRNRKFGIRTDDRRRHMYVIGKTGMGKSTMLENMIVQDIREGRGVGIVDPHGDLAEKIVDYIPANRLNDVIYFNPADVDYPIAFNILESVDDRYKHLVASGLMGVFTKIWENVWSARMEYILNNCILALLDSPGNTLLGINRVLVDKQYRHKIVSRITDPVVRSFWVNEYANYSDKFRTEAIAPIQNKVGQFLSTAIVRNIVGQTKSTIDLREIMDTGKILIMNLAKGRLGEDNSALLGAMMITKLQVAAMSRVDVPEHERRDFYLYVDEFQNFATTAFADILSEARKYRLSLIMAHQYIEQLDETVAAAVFGNVGTITCFRVGATDAEDLVKEFTPQFTEEDLVNLTKFEIYLRLMINGVASKPFSASSLAPLRADEKTGNKEKMIDVSRERYSRPRAEVEEKIIRWTDVEEIGVETAKVLNTRGVPEEEQRFNNVKTVTPPSLSVATSAVAPVPPHTFLRPAEIHSTQSSVPHSTPRPAPTIPSTASEIPRVTLPQPPLPRNVSPGKETREVTCDNCGKGTLVVFEPDEKRNVFCKRCLKLFKNGMIDASSLKKRNIQEKYDDLPPLVAIRDGIKTLPIPHVPAEPVSRPVSPPVVSAAATAPATTMSLSQAPPIEEPTIITLSEALQRVPISFHYGDSSKPNRGKHTVVSPHIAEPQSAVLKPQTPTFQTSHIPSPIAQYPVVPPVVSPVPAVETQHFIRGIPPGRVVTIRPQDNTKEM